MDNENEQVDIEGGEDEEVLEPANATTDWEARARRLEEKASIQRERTRVLKLRLTKLEKAASPKSEDKKSDDYAELSYLAVKGIESDEEIALVREAMKDTGKPLREIVTSKWFQAQLKETREVKATKDAIPSGSKRSSSPAKDSVDYWITKGEMPPRDQMELRQKVVEARMKAEKSRSQFTDNPVV